MSVDGGESVTPGPGAWQARFIGGPDAHRDGGRPAPYFRTDFVVGAGLRAARLHVTGLGLVAAHLNGSVVGDEVLCPGWTSYRHRLMVSTHDVTGIVREGANAVGAIVGEGWAVGRLSWEGRRNLWSDRPAPFLQLELDYADRTEVVASGVDWRTSTGAVLADGIYDGEIYDARLDPMGWDQPGYDDASWSPVVVLDLDAENLVGRSMPPIRRTEEIAPVDVITTPSGQTVVDFGQILSGWVRLRVEGPAGTTVTIRHAELLVDGEPEYETNRTARATDRYTLAGGGTEIWEPRFTFHGFRYATLDGWPGEMRAEDITAIVVHIDVPRIGWFECSDERLNQLHRNVVWSWRGNSVGLPTDCPQRDERLGWTGDINAFAPTAAFLYNVRESLGSWLEDLAAEQTELGQVPVVVPNVLDAWHGPTALWGDVAVSLPWTLYQQYGDVEVLRRQYSSMCAFIESVGACLDGTGRWSSGFQFGDWVDPDSPPGNPSKAKAEKALVATAYLHRTVGQLAATARLLGHGADADRYEELQVKVRAGFRGEWVTPTGRLSNECETSYALAICFGLLDPEQEHRAGDRLVELLREGGYRIKTGFAGTPWVAPALTRTGHDDVAYRLLLQTEPPSFLYPLSQGATTVWERWDAVLPNGTLNSTGMTSLNHYALGAVTDWIHRRIGGLAPAEPGYRKADIAPRPGGGLTWATTTLDSAAGRYRVAWSDNGGERRVEVTVPTGASARVTLPDHPDGIVADVGPGDHDWVYPSPPADVFGLHTPMELLRDDPDVWAELYALFSTVMPGVSNLLDHIADASPDLATALEHLPGVTQEFHDAVAGAFAHPA